MNEVLCPRCGHDHGEHWGDEGWDGRTCEQPDSDCRCRVPLSEAMRAASAQVLTDVLSDVHTALTGIGSTLERIEAEAVITNGSLSSLTKYGITIMNLKDGGF